VLAHRRPWLKLQPIRCRAVARHGQSLAILAKSDEAVPPMAVVHISTQQACHQGRNMLRIPQLDQQVKMIVHQTVVVKPQAKARYITGNQAQKGATILVVGENDLSVVASVHQVKTGLAGPLQTPWQSRH
jgi:hypothetical protein